MNSTFHNEPGKSGFFGVTLRGKRYQAQITNNGKLENIGTYDTKEEAAQMFDEKARELGRPLSHLNDPSKEEKKSILAEEVLRKSLHINVQVMNRTCELEALRKAKHLQRQRRLKQGQTMKVNNAHKMKRMKMMKVKKEKKKKKKVKKVKEKEKKVKKKKKKKKRKMGLMELVAVKDVDMEDVNDVMVTFIED
jgi:hypothetical protein